MRRAEIIERLEKAEGFDRDIDADIYIEFNIPAERVGRLDRLGGCVGWWPKDAPYESAVDVPRYTASLDAAIALVERTLPGWRFAIERRANGMTLAWLTEEDDAPCIPAMHSKDCHALLISLFRALEAKEAGNG